MRLGILVLFCGVLAAEPALMPMPAKMSGAIQPSTIVMPPPEDRPATYTWFGSIAYCELVTKRLTKSSSTPTCPLVRLGDVLA